MTTEALFWAWVNLSKLAQAAQERSYLAWQAYYAASLRDERAKA